jgi:hypothetical protein
MLDFLLWLGRAVIGWLVGIGFIWCWRFLVAFCRAGRFINLWRGLFPSSKEKLAAAYAHGFKDGAASAALRGTPAGPSVLEQRLAQIRFEQSNK